MPEPVVIIGPASGPAGPIPGQPNPVGRAAAAAANPADQGETVVPPSRGRRILRAILSLLGRVSWAAGTTIMYVIRRNPRHSLAAAASLLILGGIYYTQTRFGNTRRVVTNAISANSPPATESKDPDAKPDPALAAAAPKPETSEEEQKAAAADAVNGPMSAEPTTATAGADSASRPNLPAPKPAAIHDDTAATTTLALSGGPEKPAENPAVQPAPASSAADPTALPRPAPAGDVGKATLLEASTEPASGGTPPAPSSSLAKDKQKSGDATNTSASPGALAQGESPAPRGAGPGAANAILDVPADLLLAEGAPKAGGDDSKSVKTGEKGLAPAPSGANRSLEEPRKPDGPNPKPIEPDQKLAAEKPSLPVSATATPAPLPQNPPEQQPVAATAATAPDLMKEFEAPASKSKVDGAVQGNPKAAATQEPPARAGDSGSPELAPPVAAPASGSESAKGTRVVDGAGRAPARSPKRPEPISEPSAGPSHDRDETPGTVAASASRSQPTGETRARKDLDEAGWITIPNSGKIPVDATDNPVGGSALGDAETGSELAAAASDFRAHASRAVDFEPEPSQSPTRERGEVDSSAGGRPSGANSARRPQPRAASHSERVEAVDHLVDPGENYWTISRLYYNSGRYYKALWKANEAKYPDIKLHVGDVIVIPAVEDLDPDFIAPARTRPPADSLAAADLPRRRGQGSRPPDEAGRSAAASALFDGDAVEPEARTSARPRGPGGGAAPGRPMYRVRSYDTLRSIARDTLGDARRADEIVALNRGLIDDPAQLVAGQLLELPEDARTSIRRPASRR